MIYDGLFLRRPRADPGSKLTTQLVMNYEIKWPLLH